MGKIKRAGRDLRRKREAQRVRMAAIIRILEDDRTYTFAPPGKDPITLTGREWKERAFG